MQATINMRLLGGAFTVAACVTAMSVIQSPNAATAQEVTPATNAIEDASPASAGSTSLQDRELIALRDEVRALRQDVQRLLQLLELQGAQGKPTGPNDSGQSDRAAKLKQEKRATVLYQKAYAAADLVVPVERVVKAAVAGQDAEVPVPVAAKPDFDSLEELIMENVAPETWERAGGDATIQRFPNNLSFVITQSETNHQRIVELFEKLRRGHDRIILKTRIISRANPQRLGLTLSPHKPQILSWEEAKALLDKAQSDRTTNLLQSPVIAVPSGQVGNIRLPVRGAGEMDLLIHADVEEPSDAIRLGFVVNAKDAVEALSSNASIVVRRGQTVIIDVTERLTRVEGEQDLSLLGRLRSAESAPADSAKAMRTLVVVTPEHAEDEALLGIPSTP